MAAFVTKEAPDFTAQAVMPDNSFQEISLSQYRGKYVILFFYPLDFTFVCPSEIIAFDKAVAQFEAKNCQVLGASVDSHFTHLAWKNTPRNQGGIGKVAYPLVADLSKQISVDYGVLLEGGIALRGLFLIDKEGILRHAVINDLPIGRSVPEALRVLSALQHFEEHGDVCPANWHEGDEAMKPSAEGVAEYLAKHGD
ncbi:MAG: peroxiredoxin [Thermoguttaceae bacterium]|jgi:peroxiredoxin (alkyl hydroperoxide reductase subunit C)|nr:peroxiredoxin [Thermoguttaceae bacterium]